MFILQIKNQANQLGLSVNNPQERKKKKKKKKRLPEGSLIGLGQSVITITNQWC